MKSILTLLTAFICTICVAQKKATKTGTGPDPRYLVTEKSFGLVMFTDDYDAIVKHYGADKVTDEERQRAPDSEETATFTILNIGLTDEIQIQWEDDAFHKKILAVESVHAKHVFKTKLGVKQGTTITQLAKLNSKKISFSGFGWGFGGLITNYNKGKLAGKEGKFNINYELNYDYGEVGGNANEKLLGDIQLDSDMALVKKEAKKITVQTISVVKW
jgi:hypothetical protein